MKKVLLFCSALICFTPAAMADYYRASGGGVYELYVNDCSETGMRRALDNAVASRRAVITRVKCAADDRARPVPEKIDWSNIYMETIPAEYLCPCAIVMASPCGC